MSGRRSQRAPATWRSSARASSSPARRPVDVVEPPRRSVRRARPLDGREIRLVLPPRGLAAVEPDGGVVVSRGGRSDAFPARDTVRVPTPLVVAEAVRRGWSIARRLGHRRRLPAARDGDVRRGSVRRRVEAAAATPARLRRGRAARRATAVCDWCRRGAARRSSAHERDARRGARLRRLARGAAANGGRVAAAARLACSSEPSRTSGTGPRASTATAARGSRFSRAAPTARVEGSEWYVDGGDARPERSLKLLLVGGGLQRSPSIGFRLAVDRLDACRSRGSGWSRRRRCSLRRSRRCCSATSAPTSSRSSIRRSPTRRAGTGPSKDGAGLWFKTLARNKRLITLDLSKPAGATSSCASSSAPTS